MGQVWTDMIPLVKHLEWMNQHYITQPKLVCTSGGYDCLHVGHLRCIQESAKHGELLVVIVNGDGFLMRKKGHVFMPLEERLEIVAGIARVSHVVAWDDGTQFVDGALRLLRPQVFTKGGDRNPQTMSEPEIKACEDIGCEIVYGVGGAEKIQSSSRLIDRAKRGV